MIGIRVSHPDLQRALQSTGFDKYLPIPPTPRVALRRALAEWIRAKQRIARNLQLHQDDEDQDDNGRGRRRTLIRVINRAGSGGVGGDQESLSDRGRNKRNEPIRAIGAASNA
jgi:hypothetical protein